MDKKRLILLIILLLAIVLIVLGVKGNVFKENRQNMELRSSGDDNSHLVLLKVYQKFSLQQPHSNETNENYHLH